MAFALVAVQAQRGEVVGLPELAAGQQLLPVADVAALSAGGGVNSCSGSFPVGSVWRPGKQPEPMPA
ncbi:MAG: hypothetical protein L0K86_23220 [Actinomycetia bacterium]|nr:hypothetical protein [Actinomycetes bacterium]